MDYPGVLGSHDLDVTAVDPCKAPLPYEVIRSSRRKKTSSARIVDGVIEVRIPAWLSEDAAHATVVDLVARVTKSHDMSQRGPELVERAARLAAQFDLPEPSAIRWVGNQDHRWGSCTGVTGEVRISSRLRNVPAYVLDYVIVHELAHLIEANHGAAFKAIERRFPKAERAEGFLEAMALSKASPAFVAD